MLEFIEKSYFEEVERKTKLQTAFAFPTSMMVVGTALIGHALDNWVVANSILDLVGVFLLAISVIALATFLYNAGIFLVSRTYRYMWTANKALEHFVELEDFSKRFPEAPPATTTFKDHLVADLANCAEKNAGLNDARSANLYWANIAVFIYILAGLVGAAIPSSIKLLESKNAGQEQCPTPSTAPTAATR